MPSNPLNASKDAKIKLSRPKSSGPNQRANKIADKVMDGYYNPIIQANMSFINSHLENNEWFAGTQLSGADFQMSFPLEASVARGVGKHFPAIEAFVAKVHQRDAYKRALEKGGEYDFA